MFFTAYDLCGSSLVKLKAEGQTVETENLIEKLAWSGFKQPGPVVLRSLFLFPSFPPFTLYYSAQTGLDFLICFNKFF